MSAPTAPPATTISSNAKNDATETQSTEEFLTSQLKKYTNKASKRPLEPTYDHLLLRSSTVKPPKLSKKGDVKLYKHFGADLRATVESYMQIYGAETVNGPEQGVSRGIGRYRKPLEDTPMRAAFTLRECKTASAHEQKGLIRAALAANNARRLPGRLIDEGTRKGRRMEAMALGLQQKQKERDRKLLSNARRKLLDLQKASLERERALEGDRVKTQALDEKLRMAEEEQQTVRDEEMYEAERLKSIERERARSKAKKLMDEREKQRQLKLKEEEEKRARMMETPEEALHRFYAPMFHKLWDMEFANLHNTNPFRIVIDATNCAAMGCPDYCDVIQKPMNLTYIKEKVEGKKYKTLQQFFEDVKLLIENALLYNSDPNNPYHIAANVMMKKYQKLGEKVMIEVQQQQHQG